MATALNGHLLDYHRYAPNKKWHIDTVMKVLTTVRTRTYLLFVPLVVGSKPVAGRGVTSFTLVIHFQTGGPIGQLNTNKVLTKR